MVRRTSKGRAREMGYRQGLKPLGDYWPGLCLGLSKAGIGKKFNEESQEKVQMGR